MGVAAQASRLTRDSRLHTSMSSRGTFNQDRLSVTGFSRQLLDDICLRAAEMQILQGFCYEVRRLAIPPQSRLLRRFQQPF